MTNGGNGSWSGRAEARRTALAVTAERAAERAAKEKRVARLVVTLLTELGARDAAVREFEQRAGVALDALVTGEGLSMREVVARCAGVLTSRDVARLRAIAAHGIAGDTANPTPP